MMIRPAESTLSDNEQGDADASDEDSDGEDAQPQKHYAFPDLDQRIRECVKEYEAVFPKLNFSSPKVLVKLISMRLPSF